MKILKCLLMIVTAPVILVLTRDHPKLCVNLQCGVE